MDSETFDRSKIYEKLDYKPAPENYAGVIPWKVQQQISATNGIHYGNTVGKLTQYPIPDMPVTTADNNELLLDIGCGWGRWLVAGAQKNYIPVGLDLRLEFCETARQVMADNKLNGYTVLGDLREIPFKENIFNVVWSFSVIQHTHKERLINCINSIYKILKGGGYCMLEFPNKGGIRNRVGPLKEQEREKDNYDSWCVRYYTVKEYKDFFIQKFKNFSFTNHSFLGIGVLPNDIKYVKGFKNKLGISVSLFLSMLTQIIKPLKYLSDSIYIKCKKEEPGTDENAVNEFLKMHAKDGKNNLNIVSLLRCPISGGSVVLDESGTKLFSPLANVYYPVINNIPVMIRSEAIKA